MINIKIKNRILERHIKYLKGDQRILKAVGPGAEDVSRYGLILTDIEVQLHTLCPARVVADGVGEAGELFAAARGEVEVLGLLQLVVAQVWLRQVVRQQELERLQGLRGYLPAHGLEIGHPVLIGEKLGRGGLLRRSAAQKENCRGNDQPQ